MVVILAYDYKWVEMSIKPDFAKSTRRLGTAFAIAANLAVGGLIAYTVLENDLLSPQDNSTASVPESPEIDVPSQDIETNFSEAVLAPIIPVTVTLTNGYGLRFDDRNDLFGMNDAMVNHSYYDAEYDRYHEKPPELHAAFLALGEITPLPYQAYEAAAWKETRLQPNTVNPSSGASGYFQFKSDAFYEGLYFMRNLFPEMSEVTSLIERERATEENNYTITYHPVNDAARERLNELIHDPLVSGMAYYAYLDHYMRNFVQERLPDLEPNQTDYYLISFRGPGGASTFLEALQDSPNALAHEMFITDSHPEGFTHPFVVQNKSVYYNAETEEYRTYQEVYDYIADDMGIGRAPVLNTHPNTDVSIVSVAEQDRRHVIPTDAVIFSENIVRPVARPDPPADNSFAIADGPNH